MKTVMLWNKLEKFLVSSENRLKTVTRQLTLRRTIVLTTMIALTGVGIAHAGSLSPAANPAATFYTLGDIYTRLTTNATATEADHVFSPGSAPAASLYTLTEVYDAIPTIVANTVKLGTSYLGVAGTLTPDGGTAGVADLFNAKTANLTNDWTLDTGTLNLACNTGTFDGAANLVANGYDGSGDGTNRFCMTDSGDATAANLTANVKAWVDGIEITGTMTDREGDNASSAQSAAAGLNYFTAPSGFYDGDDRVSATDAQVAALDADIATNNIASGVSIFGVSGNSNVVNTSSGDAVVGDLLTGKKAWVDGSEITGTAAAAIDYSQQSLVEYDDYEIPDGTSEEASWTETVADVYYDQRTGLFWSASQGAFTNIFPDQDHSTCPFFAAADRGTYDGSDADCGNAINACGTLSLDSNGGAAETDWYLPSQKELMQAYIDGIYNQDAAWATTSYFWSSTEQSNSQTNAWLVYLVNGGTYGSAKTISYGVRCVRRD